MSRSDAAHTSMLVEPPLALTEPRSLVAAEVDVWLAPYAAFDASELEALAYILSNEERARRRRFHFERDRLLFLVTRLLVRTCLSYYAPIAPAAWQFEKNEHGRPFIANDGQRGLYFNLSNTHGLVACAVARDRPGVGVDVERQDRRVEVLAIANRFFSSREVRDLHALPVTRHQRRFLSLWTLKESYIKARSMGLALPLGEFSFLLDGPIAIDFGALDDEPERWAFALWNPTEDHVLALARERGDGGDAGAKRHAEPLSVGVIQWTPGLAERAIQLCGNSTSVSE